MDARGLVLAGLGLLALAGFAWVGACAAYECEALDLAPLALVGLGFGASAWGHHADRRDALRGGLALATLGMAWFLANQLPGLSVETAPTILFTLGVAGWTGSAFAGREAGVRISAAVAAFGALLWLPVDGLDAVLWQPGNLLALVGAALVAANAGARAR